MKRKRIWQLWIDRILTGSTARQIAVLSIATLAVFMLLCTINVLFNCLSGLQVSGIPTDSSPFWSMWYFFSDPGNQVSLETGSSELSVEPTSFHRLFAAIVSTLGAIFFGGLLISTLSNIIQRRVDACKDGLAHYNLKNHVVIIGTDPMIYGIINQIARKSEDPIAVLTSENVEEVRMAIHANLSNPKDADRIILNYGIRNSDNALDNVCITKAKEVYVLGNQSEFDDIECFHDSLNVQCLTHIAHLCIRDNRTGLPCYVSFEYNTTYHVFQYADLQETVAKHIRFHPFNFYELWAQKVLVSGLSTEADLSYKPLDYRNITSEESDEYVHFVIIGLSRMGEAMAMQAAHIAHYPNYRKRKTRITIIDKDMEDEMFAFKQKCGVLFDLCRSEYIDVNGCHALQEAYSRKQTHLLSKRYEHLATDADDKEFIDIEWTFVNGADSHPVVRELLEQYACESKAILTIAVCLNLTHASLGTAMHLPPVFYEKEIPILVQQRKTSAMVNVLNGIESSSGRDSLRYRNLTPFGMVANCYDLQMEDIMRYAMRINAVYTHYFRTGTDPVSLEDTEATRQWQEVVTSKRWSNIYAAASIPTKLRCVSIAWQHRATVLSGSLSDKQVDILAQMEHNRWNVEELLLGYRPVTLAEDRAVDADKDRKKDLRNKRIHYDIRPYDGLKPDAQSTSASTYDKMIIRNLPLIIN